MRRSVVGVLCVMAICCAATTSSGEQDGLASGQSEQEFQVATDQANDVPIVSTHAMKAFDATAREWIDLPAGAMLRVKQRCTGWMNSLAYGSSGERHNLYFREWDLARDDEREINEHLPDTCRPQRLTRELVVMAQRQGLVQVFTNKTVTPHGETGASIIVGPRFPHGDSFVVERTAMTTTGMLKIPANRPVVLENDPCRPFIGVKIQYAGGVYWVRALDLDIRMAGENLAKSPLGSAAWILCDEPIAE